MSNPTSCSRFAAPVPEAALATGIDLDPIKAGKARRIAQHPAGVDAFGLPTLHQFLTQWVCAHRGDEGYADFWPCKAGQIKRRVQAVAAEGLVQGTERRA